MVGPRDFQPAGLAVKRARGEAVGHTPFGSDRDGRKLVPNGNEAATIARITTFRAKGMTLAAIADELNRAGIPTKKGCAWSAMQVQRIVNRPA